MFKKKQKPLKEVKGTDENLANAMKMQAREQMSTKERDEDDRKQWLASHMKRVQAHGERFFDTDEDLPFSAHLLLFFILAFWIIFILWASFANLDEVTRGDGTVVPSSDVQKISSLEGGIVEEFFSKKAMKLKKMIFLCAFLILRHLLI